MILLITPIISSTYSSGHIAVYRCLRCREWRRIPAPQGGYVRLLHFADLHLDTPFRWAPPEVARARRRYPQPIRLLPRRRGRLARIFGSWRAGRGPRT